MNHLHEHDPIPLPPLSDAAAVEILYFLEAMYQIVETRYAAQIWRYYQRNNVIRAPPSRHAATPDDEPF